MSNDFLSVPTFRKIANDHLPGINKCVCCDSDLGKRKYIWVTEEHTACSKKCIVITLDTEHARKMNPKTLIVKHEIDQCLYYEARQFFSDQEIREVLKDDGLNGLRNEVRRLVAANQRGGL